MILHVYLGIVLALALCFGSAVQAQSSAPAVDGINGKISVSAGLTNDNIKGLAGAVSIPLGSQFGLQLDGSYTEYDSNSQAGDASVYGAAAHLFWRDPVKGLIGAHGQYVRLGETGGVNAYVAAAEGALYRGRFTLEGSVGYIDGDISSSFFDDIQVAYYPIDDLKLNVGHAYTLESNYLTYGAEWRVPSQHTVAASLFVQGEMAEGGGHQASAGLRVYFGRKPKTLIERHRQDDPVGLGPQNMIRIQSAIAQFFCNQGINVQPGLLPYCVPTN